MRTSDTENRLRFEKDSGIVTRSYLWCPMRLKRSDFETQSDINLVVAEMVPAIVKLPVIKIRMLEFRIAMSMKHIASRKTEIGLEDSPTHRMECASGELKMVSSTFPKGFTGRISLFIVGSNMIGAEASGTLKRQMIEGSIRDSATQTLTIHKRGKRKTRIHMQVAFLLQQRDIGVEWMKHLARRCRKSTQQ